MKLLKDWLIILEYLDIFTAFDVSVFRSFEVSVFRCFDVSMFRYFGVLVFRCFGVSFSFYEGNLVSNFPPKMQRKLERKANGKNLIERQSERERK